jgi:hypothetical protein
MAFAAAATAAAEGQLDIFLRGLQGKAHVSRWRVLIGFKV